MYLTDRALLKHVKDFMCVCVGGGRIKFLQMYNLGSFTE